MATSLIHARKARVFTVTKAVRKKIPVWAGLAGPSGCGKTFSALRIAEGMRRKTGGKIGVIDTENNRALAYANDFDFFHLPFSPPFDSLSYLDAVNQLIREGCTVGVIDSMSHEHDGIGGLLEQHEAELDRLCEQYGKSSREQLSMLAWGPPKAARRLMIQTLLQLPINLIICYRAKEKVKLRKGGVDQLGWMPIAAEEMVYEMTIQALLPPKSDGIPIWKPDGLGEKTVVKLPRAFRKLFERPRQFDEDMGFSLATWGAGEDAVGPSEQVQHGSDVERAPVIKELGQLRETLKMSTDDTKAWRQTTFGETDVKKLSIRQLEDARTLLTIKRDQGEEEYEAEYASLVELGRVRPLNDSSKEAQP